MFLLGGGPEGPREAEKRRYKTFRARILPTTPLLRLKSERWPRGSSPGQRASSLCAREDRCLITDAAGAQNKAGYVTGPPGVWRSVSRAALDGGPGALISDLGGAGRCRVTLNFQRTQRSPPAALTAALSQRRDSKGAV